MEWNNISSNEIYFGRDYTRIRIYCTIIIPTMIAIILNSIGSSDLGFLTILGSFELINGSFLGR